MTIWLDGDAAPRAVKEIVFRAATRRQVPVVMVANRWQQVPRSTWIKMVVVEGGLDRADEHIVEQLAAGDLVITADIPLAADAVANGATILRFRGEILDKSNVKQRLAVRDLMDDLRGAGVQTRGPAPFGQKDGQRFANALDRWLTRNQR
ncbi:MAG: YaiI/YqxD family protein [Myxococcota bacterium]